MMYDIYEYMKLYFYGMNITSNHEQVVVNI